MMRQIKMAKKTKTNNFLWAIFFLFNNFKPDKTYLIYMRKFNFEANILLLALWREGVITDYDNNAIVSMRHQ
jgi:hypothetical protein